MYNSLNLPILKNRLLSGYDFRLYWLLALKSCMSFGALRLDYIVLMPIFDIENIVINNKSQFLVNLYVVHDSLFIWKKTINATTLAKKIHNL